MTLEPSAAVAEWATLPEDLRALVKEYLAAHPPDTLRAFLIGPPSAAAVEERSIKMREVARLLAALIAIEDN
jgi:hypothetical protein